MGFGQMNVTMKAVTVQAKAATAALKETADQAKETSVVAEQAAGQIVKRYDAVRQFMENTNMINLHDPHTMVTLVRQLMENIMGHALPTGPVPGAAGGSRTTASPKTTITKKKSATARASGRLTVQLPSPTARSGTPTTTAPTTNTNTNPATGRLGG